MRNPERYRIKLEKDRPEFRKNLDQVEAYERNKYNWKAIILNNPFTLTIWFRCFNLHFLLLSHQNFACAMPHIWFQNFEFRFAIATSHLRPAVNQNNQMIWDDCYACRKQPSAVRETCQVWCSFTLQVFSGWFSKITNLARTKGNSHLSIASYIPHPVCQCTNIFLLTTNFPNLKTCHTGVIILPPQTMHY